MKRPQVLMLVTVASSHSQRSARILLKNEKTGTVKRIPAGGNRMAISTNLISAAAGLAGAIIGGTSTYLANRIQWRRESRRKAYADLIGTAYSVESFIADGLQKEVASNAGSSISKADPRTEFYSGLDSAILLAKWKTQNALHKWRGLSLSLDSFESLAESDRILLRSRWQDRQNEFYDCAKHELGVQGRYSYRRVLVIYALIATALMLIYFGLHGTKPNDAWFNTARWMVAIAAFISLSLALRASWRYRQAVEHSPGVDWKHVSPEELRKYIVKTADPLQIGIATALACSILALVLEGVSEVSRILMLVGFSALGISCFPQWISSGSTVLGIIKFFRGQPR
jgi:hypothetical protein